MFDQYLHYRHKPKRFIKPKCVVLWYGEKLKAKIVDVKGLYSRDYIESFNFIVLLKKITCTKYDIVSFSTDLFII